MGIEPTALCLGSRCSTAIPPPPAISPFALSLASATMATEPSHLNNGPPAPVLGAIYPLTRRPHPGPLSEPPAPTPKITKQTPLPLSENRRRPNLTIGRRPPQPLQWNSP